MENESVLATVGAVYSDGLSLIFDGQTEPSRKHYKCNTSVSFSAGDRVKILKDSGTCIVEYVVGNPKSGGGSGGGDVSQLVNGSSVVKLSSNGFLYPSKNEAIYLGAQNYAWRGLWANGSVHLGLNSGDELKLGGLTSKIGFFDTTPIERPVVANTASVSTLITALKKIGLIR